MSAQTDECVDSIEHLDHQPQCESCDNPAAVWVNVHGCGGYLSCMPCYEKGRAKIDAFTVEGTRLRCSECSKRFYTFDQWAPEVRPL